MFGFALSERKTEHERTGSTLLPQAKELLAAKLV
jgi:hypothetical protein